MCKDCGIIHDVLQPSEGEHQLFMCPDCGGQARRKYTVPSVKKNEGFYSDTLGKWVSGQTDFEQGLQQVRYETDQSKWLGDNTTPKDEWIENKETDLQARKKRANEEIEYSQESQHGAERE